ncbi:MAG: substrate-binding domain-containing protein [Candidatus Spyradocola sp.]
MYHHHIAKAAALTLCVLLLLAAPGCVRQERPTRVALIVSSDTGYYWENIQDGADAAAKRLGTELRVYAPDEENDLPLEVLPELAVDEGADVLVVASSGEEELVEALAQLPDVPLVALGDALAELTPFSAVLNDDGMMGQNMADALEAITRRGDGILLLTDTPEYDGVEPRESRLRSGLYTQHVGITKRIYTGNNREWAYRQTLQQLYLHRDLGAVVAFSAEATVGAAQAVEYLGLDLTVVGTDIVPDLVTCIETGRVTASVVRNSFGMGYLGVEYATAHLAGEETPARRTLSSVVVTRDNLYTPDVEKIVFPYE